MGQIEMDYSLVINNTSADGEVIANGGVLTMTGSRIIKMIEEGDFYDLKA